MAKEPGKKTFRFAASRLDPGTTAHEDVCCLQALLARYGYLGPYCPGRYDEATRQAVAQFQTFYRIYPEQDGVCDEETINLLNQPRCGVPDEPAAARSVTGRLAPYVLAGAKWDKAALAYRILNTTPDLPTDRQEEILQEAFRRWQEVSALVFHEVATDQPSELSVAFHRGGHGDGDPFDDAGTPSSNTLAHAFFPPPLGGQWAGALHFDEFESWKDQPGGPGIRLYNVALHEVGHLLGLRHSQDQNAIMYAYYSETRNDLRADDIAGVQVLYGAPQAAPVAISPGQRVSGFLPQKDVEVRYQVTLQNKLLIKLDGPSGQDFDLYVRYKDSVGRQDGQYDEVSYSYGPDELVTITDPKPGTYNILVHRYRGSGSYTLEVELV